MKVKLKSILKTTDTLFQPFQQNQIIYQAGNTLTIKQFNKPSCDFIHLTKQLIHLYNFKPTPNKKACFVAQKLLQQKINISYYTLKKQRKTVCLSDCSQFFPTNIVDNIELLVDQFDSFLVYGYARAGTDTCIFLVDFNKMKIVSIGYVNSFNDIKVNTKQNLTLTLCYGNTVRTTHVYNGFWQTDQKMYKKLGNVNIIKHEILTGDMLLLCTKSHLYFIQEMEIIQSIVVFEQNQDEILEVIKLTKAILVLSRKEKIRIYVEDHDQLTYIYKGEVRIGLKEGQKVSKIVMTGNCEEVLLRTNKNEIYQWKVEELEVPTEIVYEFQKVENATIGQAKGTLSLASGKQVALLGSDNNVILWDLEKNTSTLQNGFTKLDQQSQKALYASALNPDGNSLICSFDDKVKIYKILLTKLRFIAQFNIKKCSQLIYSHGGQYVACKYGKGINSTITILNTLRMSQIVTFKTHSQPTFIIWNQMDDQIIVATQNNQITTFKLSQTTKCHSIKIAQKINMIRIDYMTKKLLVSTDKHIYVILNEQIQKTIEPKISKFNFIYPLHGMYFIASKDGNLYWSTQISFQNYNQLPIFINQPFNLIYRNGYMLAYSSFQNITIIECLRQNIPAKKQLLKTSQDIVFVQKDQINKFFQKIKNLQSNLQLLQSSTVLRLQQQKKKYDQSLNHNINKFTQQIAFLQKRYNQINQQKIKQQKQNNRVFQDLQSGQIKSVNDIQKMYDRKLKLQKEKYLDLEQKNVEQKIHYEKVIYELEKRYHEDIVKIRQQYSEKLAEEFKRIQEVKKSDIDYKKKMEYKMISLEEESEITVFEMQRMKDQKIQELRYKIVELENQQNSNKVNFHNELNKYKEKQSKYNEIQKKLQKSQKTLAQAYQRIKLLQSQVLTKNDMVQQKNNLISQQQHQIGGLQKAKYVLSFRTTQIRKQLQPKQSLIDKLKSQMFKLDEQFKQEKKKTYELAQKIEKIQKLSKILKQENTELKLRLKNRERTFEEMSYEIFIIVNEMDQKEWPSAIVKVYQQYIREDHFKNMKKKSKDAMSEEINRHLIHVEQSLMQVTAGNQKILKGKDLDVKRKMKQNADLIYDFNQLKKKYALKVKEIDEQKVKVAKLQEEIRQSTRVSTRANTAKSAGRRAVSRQRGDKNQIASFDISMRKQNEIYFQKRDIQTRDTRSRASSSGYRTMILRSDKKQNSRIFDLAKDLQNSKYKILKQQKMIEQLNHRLLERDIDE